MDNLLSSALRVASKYHEGQKRKGKDVPYIVHPIETAMILINNDMGDEIIAAGFLHDVLEDTKMTEEKLKDIFNERIVNLVKGASESLEDREKISWEERKKHTIEYLKIAEKDVKSITCADKLSNIKSMKADYEKIGDKLWDRFNRGYGKQKWYYESLVDSLKELEGLKMYKEFKSVVEKLFKE